MNVAERAVAVWRGLVQVYGERFTTIYGQDPQPIWISQLAELTDEQCRGAIIALSNLPPEKKLFPCNLTEFTKACRDAVPDAPRGRAQQPAPRRYYSAPQSGPLASPEVRARHLESMRALFAKPSAPRQEREPGQDG